MGCRCSGRSSPREHTAAPRKNRETRWDGILDGLAPWLQIAHFYSTVADHMVLSQQPLMLASAQHFTRLIGDRGRISWNDPESLDAHIAQLRGVVEKLSRENRMLRRHHFDICAKVPFLTPSVPSFQSLFLLKFGAAFPR